MSVLSLSSLMTSVRNVDLMKLLKGIWINTRTKAWLIFIGVTLQLSASVMQEKDQPFPKRNGGLKLVKVLEAN